MTLRAKQPSDSERRLKLFMYGDAGVGKTTASCQMPAPYIIDSEKGTDNYSELIKQSGGAVFQTTDVEEVIQEVRSLTIEKHDYKTLVIDPISPLYFDLIERMEEKVGNEWGKHYSEANKHMKRLVNLIMRLDMNVIITAHAKPEYGDDMKKIGTTFDGWKRLPYIFDLVLQLDKPTPSKRFARVTKTRIKSFPDGETFEWNFDELSKRYSVKELERNAVALEVASEKQIVDINKFSSTIADGEEYVEKCLSKAGVDSIEDLSIEQADKMLSAMKKKVGIK
tara:strand:+ start:732 stop:1574 length:843 start_codon:yes stop_codon:yes gene_type:complete